MVDNLCYIKRAYAKLDNFRSLDHTLLTDAKLNEVIATARPIVLELYMKCEENYQKGLQIYEAIIHQKWLDVLHLRVINLNKQKIELTTM